MRKIKLIAILAILFSGACISDKGQQQDQKQYEELRKEIDELKVKLEATEAQLLNVRSELSGIITMKDSSNIKE